MGKYAPLKTFLMEQDRDRVPLTFEEIEKILGASLPSSKRYPAWWSNNPGNNPMTREWLDAGFETESVNIAGEKLTFRRVRSSASPAASRPARSRQTARTGFGFMKGLLTIADGHDVTKPADEAWDRGYIGLEEKR